MTKKDTQNIRTTVTTIDILPPGTDEDILAESIPRTLPDGITSRMLYKDILRIAFPTGIELALTSLVSMADLIMVGGLGTWAITAVGLTTQPKFVLMTMVMAMNVGATSLVSQARGAGDQDRARLYTRQALLINLAIALFCSVAGVLSSRALVRFMGAAEARVLDAGDAYLKIQMAGFVFYGITSTITAVLRGIGDSRTAMYYNSIANIVNILLNYLLIGGNLGFPALGVAGASLATTIGQFVAFLLAIAALSSKNCYLRTGLHDDFRPRHQECREIVSIALPAALEQLMMRAGSIVFSRTIASLGTLEFAAHQVCMNIQSLTMMNGQIFSVSATTLMGQGLGRKRPDMAQAYTSRCRLSGMLVAVTLGVMFILFGRPLSSLYTNDPLCIASCLDILWIVALIQPFQSSQFIVAGALRGAGDTKFVAKLTFFTVLLLRPGLAILAVNHLHLGLVGAWMAIATDQILRAAAISLRYRSGKWKILCLRKNNSAPSRFASDKG